LALPPSLLFATLPIKELRVTRPRAAARGAAHGISNRYDQFITVTERLVDSTIVPDVAVICAVPDPVELAVTLMVTLVLPGELAETAALLGDRLQVVCPGPACR